MIFHFLLTLTLISFFCCDSFLYIITSVPLFYNLVVHCATATILGFTVRLVFFWFSANVLARRPNVVVQISYYITAWVLLVFSRLQNANQTSQQPAHNQFDPLKLTHNRCSVELESIGPYLQSHCIRKQNSRICITNSQKMLTKNSLFSTKKLVIEHVKENQVYCSHNAQT